jgi:hypothetical protein
MVARVLLVVAVVGLGAVVLYTATGGLGTVVASIGTSFGGLVDKLTTTGSPAPSSAVVADAPIVEAPSEPYTNQKHVDIVVTVPSDVVGKTGAVVRLYVAPPKQEPAVAGQDTVIGSTPRVVIPDVVLTKGVNNFGATVVTAGGVESDMSPLVSYILDMSKPKITLTSPKDGATVNRSTVKLTGRTQGRSGLTARNSANGVSTTGTAAGNGSFTLNLALDNGTNAITITATDPAGNVGQLVLSVKRGSGKLTAALTSSTYRLRISRLPEPIELDVLVTDPDGNPLEGASVTFSLTVPGVPPLTFQAETGGDGKASFRTTVPKGATVGTGPASVLVRTDDFGKTTARTVISVVH